MDSAKCEHYQMWIQLQNKLLGLLDFGESCGYDTGNNGDECAARYRAYAKVYKDMRDLEKKLLGI